MDKKDSGLKITVGGEEITGAYSWELLKKPEKETKEELIELLRKEINRAHSVALILERLEKAEENSRETACAIMESAFKLGCFTGSLIKLLRTYE